jgi:plasmid stabilization system protein ParE
MPKLIVWSPSAEYDFAIILSYLNENWNEQVTNHFIDLTEGMLLQISNNPRQFPVIFKKERVRKCVLTKHNTLFYRVSTFQIEILRVFDSRQDPKTLTLK